jgi:hypothetical protein
VSGGALAFDPWAALGAEARRAPERAPDPPRPPNPAYGVAPPLGGLGGLGGRTGPDRASGLDCLDHDEVEAAALAAHYAAPPNADPWHPGKADPLRDGLLASALGRPRHRAI